MTKRNYNGRYEHVTYVAEKQNVNKVWIPIQAYGRPIEYSTPEGVEERIKGYRRYKFSSPKIPKKYRISKITRITTYHTTVIKEPL